jgi:hypothetical protein
MIRSILGIIAGIVVGGFVVGLIEIPGMLMHPLPPGTDMSNPAVLKEHLAKAPFVALLGVAIAWTIGPLVGSWLAATIARRAHFVHGLIVGLFFLAADVMNIVSFPHPRWLVAVGVLAPLISSWLGASLAARMASPKLSGPQPYDMRERNMAC